MKFTEYPRYLDPESYTRAIQFMAGMLMDTGMVKCVYQVGGVSSPGISDLDLFVVFRNDTRYNSNPVASLTFPNNYLFSHKLFGTSEQLAPMMERFTFFGKYNLIAGENMDMFSRLPSEADTRKLKPQIALEYLVKAWIAISTAMEFQTIKLRSFLLHAKAVQYDLNFLEVRHDALSECVQRIIDIRRDWFEKPPSEKELSSLIGNYRQHLLEYVRECIAKYHFYLPEGANQQIAGSIALRNSDLIQMRRNGIMLPAMLTSNSKTLFKINNMLNNFTAEIPLTTKNIPPIIQERFRVLKEAFEYNRSHLPFFICTGHGMNIFTDNKHSTKKPENK